MQMLRAEMKKQTDQNKSLTRRNIRIGASARSGAMKMIAGTMMRKLKGSAGVALQRWAARAQATVSILFQILSKLHLSSQDHYRAKEISDMRANLEDQMGSQRRVFVAKLEADKSLTEAQRRVLLKSKEAELQAQRASYEERYGAVSRLQQEQDVYSSEVSELRTAYSTAVSELQNQIASSTDAHRQPP